MTQLDVTRLISENFVPFLVGICTVAASVYGTYSLMRSNDKKREIDHWSALQQAQTDFMSEVREELEWNRAELQRTKEENDALKHKLDEFNVRVSTLIEANEKLMTEKLEWMHRAFELQLLLSEYAKRSDLTEADMKRLETLTQALDVESQRKRL